METVILKISQFFSEVMGMVAKTGFGPTGSIAWASIFLAIGVIRIVMVWKDLRAEEGIAMGAVQFAKAYAKVAWVWFLISASPYIFGGIAATVQGNVQRAAQGSIAQEGQNLFNGMMRNIRTLWALRAVSGRHIWDQFPEYIRDGMVITPSESDALSGMIDVTKFYIENEKKWNSQLAETEASATKLLKSSNPKDREAGRNLEAIAKGQRQDLRMARDAIAGAKVGEDVGAGWKLLGGMMNPSIGSTIGINLALLAFCYLASLLVIGPSLILAVSATVKVIQSMVEIFTFLFGFAAMVVVVSAFAVVLGPLALMSFISDQWSRYGWNFVSFWIQALVASVATVVLVGIAGTAIGSIGGYMGQAAILVAGNALQDTGVLEIALKCLMAGLLFLGMGAALTFISTFLQKALSGTTGMVHGTLHP